VDLSFGLVKDAGGAVVGVLAIGRDVTEQRSNAANR
jgi:signal transduction histidine kinase